MRREVCLLEMVVRQCLARLSQDVLETRSFLFDPPLQGSFAQRASLLATISIVTIPLRMLSCRTARTR
jgi:hypothetical protein